MWRSAGVVGFFPEGFAAEGDFVVILLAVDDVAVGMENEAVGVLRGTGAGWRGTMEASIGFVRARGVGEGGFGVGEAERRRRRGGVVVVRDVGAVKVVEGLDIVGGAVGFEGGGDEGGAGGDGDVAADAEEEEVEGGEDDEDGDCVEEGAIAAFFGEAEFHGAPLELSGS